MYSLLIDTHDNMVLCALYKDSDVLSLKEIESKKGHSEIAMPTLVSTLEENHLKIKDIENIIVVIGPGSFTGVRIGVVIAKTIAYLLNLPIRTLTSIDMKAFSNEKIVPGLYNVTEKNGFFVAKYDKNGIVDEEIKYYSRKEFEQRFADNNFIDVDKLDLTNIFKHAMKKEPVNPHLVNPVYVKQIEVLK